MQLTKHIYSALRGALPLLALAAGSPLLATDFLNLKGYYDSGIGKAFNYSGEEVESTSLGAGRTRVSFPGLHLWTHFPTVQVSPRLTHTNGYDVCSAQFTQIPAAGIIVDVTCRRGGNLFHTGFVLMILDLSSDAGYAYVNQVTTCVGCGTHAYSHNPWKRTVSSQGPIRATRAGTGRTRVVFETDWPVDKSPYPIAVVSPVHDNASCQVFSVGVGGETTNELGAEVKCNNFLGSPMDTEFRLLLVPPSDRTAYALVQANATVGFGIVSNPKGSPQGYPFFGPGYIHVDKFATGKYEVRFPRIADNWPDLGATDGAIQVSSHGSSGISCGVLNFYKSGSDAVGVIGCKTVTGVFADSNFTVLLSSRN